MITLHSRLDTLDNFELFKRAYTNHYEVYIIHLLLRARSDDHFADSNQLSNGHLVTMLCLCVYISLEPLAFFLL